MKKHLIACLLILLLPLGLLTACGDNLPLVYVQSVAELMGYSNTGAFNTCAGVVMAQEEVKVERDETKEISGLCVEVGQLVHEGDVLFIYDVGNVSLEIDRMNLEIEQLKNTISDLKTQITQLEKEKKTAKESEKLAYTLQIQSLQTDQKEAEYNLALKQRELTELKTNTDTGEVKAPITGEVKEINKNGGYDYSTGAPLPYIVLSRNDAFRVKGTVNELNRDEFYVGQSVIIRSRMDTEKTWTGVISEVGTAAEDNNNDFYFGYDDGMSSSSSYPFYVTPDGSEGMLLGQHVFIEPNYGQTTTGSGLWLDASYIFGSEEEGYFVWAVDKEETIEKRALELGAYDRLLHRYEIISGLSKTDRIAFPEEGVQVGAPITEVLLQEGQDDTVTEPTEDFTGETFEDLTDGIADDGSDGVWIEDELGSKDPVIDGIIEPLPDDFELEIPTDPVDPEETGNGGPA